MMRRRLSLGGLAFLLAFVLASAGPNLGAAEDTLPTRLSDEEFWQLSQQMSEPDGYFRSDNLLSNELRFPEVIPDLIERAKTGGSVYLGVGPEQNFNYIAAIKPKMVFITDIRRGNLQLQLIYKALFELSADRNEFVSRLFTKPKQVSVTSKTLVDDLMTAYWALESSPKAAYDTNLQEIKDHLTKSPHKLPLSQDDLTEIGDIYYQFYWFGPTLTYNSSSSNGFGNGRNMATYDDLMRAKDPTGTPRSYLATEESFKTLQDLERRNLIVPVIGNFGGPKALRAVGQYVRDRGAAVAAFYLSNVEQYLRQDGIWNAFCANVATMPLTSSSTFIRSQNGGGGFGGGGGFTNYLGPMAAETEGCKPAAAAAALSATGTAPSAR